MKKIFTLAACTALVFMAKAETVTMELWTNDMGKDPALLGSISEDITYYDDDKVYYDEKFLGVDEPIEFKFEPQSEGSSYNMVITEGTTASDFPNVAYYSGLEGFANKYPYVFTSAFSLDGKEVIRLGRVLIGQNASNGGNSLNKATLSDDGKNFNVTISLYSPVRQEYNNDAWAQKLVGGYFHLKFSIPAYGVETGIENVIANAEAPVEYYTIQGVRITEPAQGQIVIRRQGNEVTKVIVK